MPNNDERKNSRTDIDRLFEKGVSEVSRAPRKTLSDEQIKAAAAASTSGAGVWLLAHAKEMLMCAVSLSVGIGGTLLVTHLTDNRNAAPTETAAAITTDTANAAMAAEDTVAFKGKIAVDDVETRHGTSLQTNQHSVPAKPTANVSQPSSDVSTPVVVKKTVVQRDTVVINETVTLKDTVYLKEN